jgi:hypothetical protein
MIDEAEKRGDISPGNFKKEKERQVKHFFLFFYKNQLNTRLTAGFS